MRPPAANVLSLFSGIGGLDLGLERAGMTTVGQVEIDPYCQRVLAKHWPEVPKHDDVRTAAQWWGSEPRPTVDLIAGGFPCQGHSVAGEQKGPGDERWGWPAYRGVIDHLTETQTEAPLVLIENVPNLTRTGLLDVLQDLAARGFDAWWGRVPAAALGAPHLRWRLFVIAVHSAGVDGRAGWAWRPARSDHDGQDQPATRRVNPWDGATWALADTFRGGRHRGTGHLAEAHGRLEPEDRGEPLADTHGTGREPGGGLGGGWGPTGQAPIGASEWPAEPDVGRVAHGVPDRVDRLRALGNAVVPQVGEYAGRLIMAGYDQTENERTWA